MSQRAEVGESAQRVPVSPEEGIGRAGAGTRKALHMARSPHSAARMPSFSEDGAGRRVLEGRLFA